MVFNSTHSIWLYEDVCKGFHFKYNKDVFIEGMSLNLEDVEQDCCEVRKFYIGENEVARRKGCT
eukprot:snap_masked-scaffold_18-processed-gene-5.31-mRNA-1 protein AED:1.00 eAED:1.00 QI:0/0/0/0/1/1/2/0/63